MDTITSRKNAYIAHLRALSSDGAYRREKGEFVCDGLKLLGEASACGAELVSILWKEGGAGGETDCPRQYLAPAELFDYASPMKSSPGPLFTVRIRASGEGSVENAIVLENVQDPGNVGTVLRTANAFGVGAVVLCGDCADLYHPKTVRATMGAIFRQRVVCLTLSELPDWLRRSGLRLYGAALSDTARDLREVDITHSAVAVGSEGRGLSRELLKLCTDELIIPMEPGSESLNAAVAASVLMWEMSGKR
ncbi:MAG: RNA methyltransferase [Oscillospiraceae bacterium]|nr:RNA methyltransferase [Oscillospiraceae bacterium]